MGQVERRERYLTGGCGRTPPPLTLPWPTAGRWRRVGAARARRRARGRRRRATRPAAATPCRPWRAAATPGHWAASAPATRARGGGDDQGRAPALATRLPAAHCCRCLGAGAWLTGRSRCRRDGARAAPLPRLPPLPQPPLAAARRAAPGTCARAAWPPACAAAGGRPVLSAGGGVGRRRESGSDGAGPTPRCAAAAA